MMAGASSVVYVVLTYNKDCPLILEQWYNQIEFFICWFMLVMYLLQLYCKADRYTFLTSNETILNLFIIMPIITMKDISMLADFYFLVAISRHLRISFLTSVLLSYHKNELGETDVDRKKNIILIILVLIIIFCTGTFQEIENS